MMIELLDLLADGDSSAEKSAGPKKEYLGLILDQNRGFYQVY